VGRPVRRLPSPEPDPTSGEDGEETKLELVPEAALDVPADAEDEDDRKERLAAGPTQDPLKLYVRQIGDGPS